MANYKNMAQKVQSKGAKNTPNDSMLAHITPLEAMYLKQRGGSGHTDPNTGIPHFDDGGVGDGLGDMGGFGPGDMGSMQGNADAGIAGAIGMDSGLADAGTFGLNDMNTVQDISSPEADAMGQAITADQDSPFGKFTQQLQSFLTGKAASAALGPAAPVAGIAMAGGKGPAAFGNSFGGALGGIAGGALGGPLGSMAGSAIGSGLGGILGGVDNGSMNGQGAATASANAASGATGNGWGDVFGGLAGMYMGNRSAGQYNQSLNNLNSIFSPDGVYAQQMRQQLERKDAAAGRRSQYGPREAQLMAALGQQQAQTLSSPGYANLMQQRNIQQNQGLNTLLGLMSKQGSPVNSAVNSLGNGVSGMMQGGGLQSLFNGGLSNNWNLGPNAGPQMPMGGTEGGGYDFGGGFNNDAGNDFGSGGFFG